MKQGMKPKNKILYLVNQFSMHGGIQKMLSLKIDAWQNYYDAEVVVVTISQGDAPIVYPPKHSFKFIDLNLPGINKHKWKEILKFRKELKRIFKTEKPDIVITTLTGIPSLILPLISPKTKKVLEIHSSGALSVSKSWRYKWFFLRRYYKVVLLNEDEKHYYELDNTTVIPNFIEITDSDFPYFSDRKKRIIAAGRVHPDKQYGHLLKIWEQLYKEFPEWNLEVYGNGDKRLLQMYNDEISNLKLKRINFFPATNELQNLLRESSIFILCSDTECFPMVLIECKSAALPAISYDSPNGPRHIISDDGILVEHNDIEKFAEELAALMKDEEKRKELSKRSWNNRFRFSDIEIIKKWEELL
ncbi:glycosyltransferase [Moheibacter stercoris]|uniref:Glycosyltransferase involved in cell wall biosynthesis n=1 Tax=Moheibacter stercoris TaxID=1628251 RepID=A0ABV2LPN1_9FLAO